MAKESKSISLRSTTIKAINECKCLNPNFDFSYKVDTVTSDWVALLNFTKIELINYFTENEVNLILDATNGMILTTQVTPILLLHGNVADNIALYGSDKVHGVDKDVLLDKLLKLTSHQAYVVLQLSQEFWNSENPNDVNIKELFMIRN